MGNVFRQLALIEGPRRLFDDEFGVPFRDKDLSIPILNTLLAEKITYPSDHPLYIVSLH